MATVPLRTPEFDAFGPWVLPVRTADDVPPLYRDHPLDITTARAAFKVPRPIVRRDANAGMDLYDHLVVLHDDVLTVLSRIPGGEGRGAGGDSRGGYRAVDVSPQDVVAIQDSVDLLDGWLVLHLAGDGGEDGAPGAGRGPVRVPYNGSSREVVGELVRELRRVYLPAAGPGDGARQGRRPPEDGAGPGRVLGLEDLGHDVGLVTFHREVAREEPGTWLLSAHAARRVAPVVPGRAGVVRRALHALWPMMLQGAVLCRDERELQVLSRRRWWARGSAPVLSLSRTVVPLNRVDDVAIRDHPGYRDVREIRVRLSGTRLTFPVPAGSQAESALLAALGRP